MSYFCALGFPCKSLSMPSVQETVVLDKTVALLAKRDGIDKVCSPILSTSDMMYYPSLSSFKWKG